MLLGTDLGPSFLWMKFCRSDQMMRQIFMTVPPGQAEVTQGNLEWFFHMFRLQMQSYYIDFIHTQCWFCTVPFAVLLKIVSILHYTIFSITENGVDFAAFALYHFQYYWKWCWFCTLPFSVLLNMVYSEKSTKTYVLTQYSVSKLISRKNLELMYLSILF